MVYFPLALLTTTALVAPDLLCFLRTYMEQRHSFFACATQSHPIFWCNSLIFSIRDVMAQKVMKSGNKFEHLLMSMPANEPFMRCAYMEKGGSHSKSLDKLASANCHTTVSQLPYDRIPIAVRPYPNCRTVTWSGFRDDFTWGRMERDRLKGFKPIEGLCRCSKLFYSGFASW